LDILKISDSKIKIMLSAADAKAYGIGISDPDYKDEKTRSAVWTMLDEAKAKVGFTHEGHKLLIQFYPSKDGGAELFVTRLENLPDKSERLLSRANDMTMLEKSFSVYKFSDLRELVKLCAILKRKNCIGKSELYFDAAEGYYLRLEEKGVSKCGGVCEFAILLEFADKIRNERMPYIREHSEVLMEKCAVEKLSELSFHGTV
jgi:negative regulator of genetic competence, sporulation and motility